jgi:hypothetical protein
LCLVAAFLLSGCSFAASRSPSKLPVDNPHFSCSAGPPTIDTVIGVPLTATAIALVAIDRLQAEGMALYAVGPAIIGVPFAISAIYGWSKHSSCKELMSARRGV